MRAVVALSLLLPGAAFAQQRPLITISNVPPPYDMLSTEEVIDDPPITLTWQADVDLNQSYIFELTYDTQRDRDPPTNPTLVILDDTPDAHSCLAHEIRGPIDDVVSGDRCTLKIRPSQIIRTEHLPENLGPDDLDFTEQPERRSIVLQVYLESDPGSETTANSATWTFEYDTLPPPPPFLTEAVPGENRIEARWTPPSRPGDVEKWEVVYCPNGAAAEVGTTTTATTGVGTDILELPCAESERKSEEVSETLTKHSVTDDVVNGVPVAIAVRSIDKFGNRGPLSNAKLQTPAPTTDFWELYKDLGGEEDGGFCFIATAAHGSYAHPVVRALRFFRDRVLKSSHAGTGLVWAYYRWSPPAADALRSDPEAASYARVALLPISLFALLWSVLPLLGAAAIAWLLIRKLGCRAGLILILLLAPAIANAETRPDPTGVLGFGFEFKGGPYLPDMANDVDVGGNRAFQIVFDGADAKALFTLGAEVQIYRGIGTAAVGGSFGFMQWVGKGVFGVSENKSGDTTVFNILPLNLVATYRFDWLADNYPVPLVPYVKGGLAYYFWWITTSTGDISRYDGADPDQASDDQRGSGGKIGITGTAGIALMLNWVEVNAAQSLYNSTGIRGTYLFAEVQAAKVDGFGGKGFDLSELTWNVGMFVEF